MRHLVLFSSLLFNLLLLVSHISLYSNILDTIFLHAVEFKYCLSCCNLKPVPYKSISQRYYYFYTSLNTLSITWSFANKMLQRKHHISGGPLPKLYAQYHCPVESQGH